MSTINTNTTIATVTAIATRLGIRENRVYGHQNIASFYTGSELISSTARWAEEGELTEAQIESDLRAWAEIPAVTSCLSEPPRGSHTIRFSDSRYPSQCAGTRIDCLDETFPNARQIAADCHGYAYLWSDGDYIGTRDYWDDIIADYPEVRDHLYPLVFITVNDDEDGDSEYDEEIYIIDDESELTY